MNNVQSNVKRNFRNHQSDDTETLRPYFIYALADDQEQVFYVGRSMNIEIRRKSHRARFGDGFELRVLEHAQTLEEADQAERKWIRTFSESGAKLRNSIHNGNQPLRFQQKHGLINVANVSLDIWREFRTRCQDRGIIMPSALEEAILDWMEKTDVEGYRIDDQEALATRHHLARKRRANLSGRASQP